MSNASATTEAGPEPTGDAASGFRRLLSSSGIYAGAALAQQGAAFLLLPVYTRFISPADYGVLELLTAFSSVLFACLMIGLPSAITKSYHRDCSTAAEQRSVLTTALAIDVPILVVFGVVLSIFARPVSQLLAGAPHPELLRLVVATGCISSVLTLMLSAFRTQERAVAFSVLSFCQFFAALLLNMTFVVHFGLGIRGVLWGNLLSNSIVLPLALVLAWPTVSSVVNRRLGGVMLRFGALLVPSIISGWIMDLSDRYVLRLFTDLNDVAVYGIGYKFGMLLHVVAVWPFQLAWPAVSFSISKESGHKETYAKTLTYLWLLLVFLAVAISLVTRLGIPVLVGEGYDHAYRVVPLIALAYAFNGVYYCTSPGLHLSGLTRIFPLLTAVAAGVNLGLNFVLIPRIGMLGAAWSTAAAFALLAIGIWTVSQRAYPVPYEYGRLMKIAAAGGIAYFLGAMAPPGFTVASAAWQLATAIAGVPILLLIFGFYTQEERTMLQRLLRPPNGRSREKLRR